MALSTHSRLLDFLIDWLVYPAIRRVRQENQKSVTAVIPEIAGDVSGNEGDRQLSKVR